MIVREKERERERKKVPRHLICTAFIRKLIHADHQRLLCLLSTKRASNVKHKNQKSNDNTHYTIVMCVFNHNQVVLE